MPQLSKSKIVAFRQCPKRLWLSVNKPELADESGSEAIFRVGNEVGDIARKIYDPDDKGHLLDPNIIGWKESRRQTEQQLNEGKAPIFEAYLQIPGALALPDVLIPEGDGWRMIEVKSSGRVKDYHLEDLAVQVYVARTSGVSITGAAIAHIDSKFVYKNEGDYSGLLCESDQTQEVFSLNNDVRGWIEKAQKTLNMSSEPLIETGPHCNSPFECPFSEHCHKNVRQPDYPLSSFYRLHHSRRTKIESLGYEDIRDVPDEDLTPINQRIKQASISGQTYFDSEGAAQAISAHKGTPYFLDFETVMMTIPTWENTRPFQQIPTQFSLHVQPRNGSLEHRDFLDLSGNNPTRRFAESLIEACGNEGPIFVYNAGFERRILRETCDQFGDLSTALQDICNRVVDLEPIARKNFYHPDQKGSWSLKSLLPAVCPELDYMELDGVQNGGMAVEAYLEAVSAETSSERRDKIRKELLDYCELDTLALVRIWEKFKERDD